MIKSIKISKLDAAKRQLETVMRLYFSHGDPVSIHTLTASAYNVLRDVTAKKGGSPMLLKDKMFDYVKPGHKKTLRKKFNEAENFFKHARRDHETALDFNTEQTEFLIYDACSQYYELTGEYPPLFHIYQVWFMANKPNLFDFSEEQAKLINRNANSVVSMGRQEYFNTILPVILSVKT